MSGNSKTVLSRPREFAGACKVSSRVFTEYPQLFSGSCRASSFFASHCWLTQWSSLSVPYLMFYDPAYWRDDSPFRCRFLDYFHSLEKNAVQYLKCTLLTLGPISVKHVCDLKPSYGLSLPSISSSTFKVFESPSRMTGRRAASAV